MEISFSGILSKKDFQKAVALASRPAHWVAAYYLVTAAMVILGIILAVQSFLTAGDTLSVRLLRTAVVVVIVGYVLANPYIQRMRLTRKAEQGGFFETPLTGYAGPEGIVYKGIANDKPLGWEVFTRLRRDDNLVVLISGDGTMAVFPRTHFATDSDWKGFNGLIDEKLKNAR